MLTVRSPLLQSALVSGGLIAFSPQVLYFGGLLGQLDEGFKFALIFTLNGVSQIFFIAAVYMANETSGPIQELFRRRAIGTELVAGVVAGAVVDAASAAPRSASSPPRPTSWEPCGPRS